MLFNMGVKLSPKLRKGHRSSAGERSVVESIYI